MKTYGIEGMNPGQALYLREHRLASELTDEDASEYAWGYEMGRLDATEGHPEWANVPTGYREGYADGYADWSR
jgi:hypothetical protein